MKENFSSLNLAKMQQADHDTLIRVEAKVDNLIIEVKEMKDGTNAHIADHEIRIKKIEDLAIQSDTFVRLKQIDDLVAWRKEFNITWRAIIGVAAGIGGIVGFVLSSLNDIMAFFTHKP